MVHQPSGGYQGQVTDIEIHTNEIKKTKQRLNEIYSKHTGKKIEEIQELLQRELTRLADGTSAQGQLTQAIELARDGASVSDIMSSTKLPKEEAEAIARYHNAQKG